MTVTSPPPAIPAAAAGPVPPVAPHVVVDALSHRFSSRGPTVLEGINLAIAPGEAVALVGRSGCGKSTLLHLLAGLIRPAAGEVRIGGAPVTGPSARWNMMFQAPSLLPWMDVSANVGLGLRYAGVEPRESRARVAELLALVHLEEHAATDVQTLSGGQQQRVALARSLATRPELLLLDEPFSALDPFTRASLQAEVAALAERFGVTLVIVTHDVDEALLLAERALVMAPRPGRIVHELAIPLPRQGRERADPQFQPLRQAVLAAFEGSTPAADAATPPPRRRAFPWLGKAAFGRFRATSIPPGPISGPISGPIPSLTPSLTPGETR